jgi:hypothetical protein
MENDNFKPQKFLKAFLVLAGILYVFGVGIVAKSISSLGSTASALAKVILTYALISVLLRIAAIAGMWRGKRWGVYLYATLTVLSVVVGVLTDGPKALLYLGGLVVLYIAVRPNWVLMK